MGAELDTGKVASPRKVRKGKWGQEEGSASGILQHRCPLHRPGVLEERALGSEWSCRVSPAGLHHLLWVVLSPG